MYELLLLPEPLKVRVNSINNVALLSIKARFPDRIIYNEDQLYLLF